MQISIAQVRRFKVRSVQVGVNKKCTAKIDVSKYPKDMQARYKVFANKCVKCHTLARPINCEFALDEEWERYVKRMMNKPGCTVGKDDGKKIWAFLAHDSRARKTGANKAAWKAHREKLLSDFKAKYAKRYEELYAEKH